MKIKFLVLSLFVVNIFTADHGLQELEERNLEKVIGTLKWDSPCHIVHSIDDLLSFRRYKNSHLLVKLTAMNIDLKIYDECGCTALHVAALVDKPKVIPFLIAAGLKVNERDYYGNTPLLNTITFANRECAIALLEAGADKNIKDNAGISPETFARRIGNREIYDREKEKRFYDLADLIRDWNSSNVKVT